MTELEKAQRTVFSVARQLASRDVRRRALATLAPGDVVQVVDTETQAPAGTRRITEMARGEWYEAAMPGRKSWHFDADGLEAYPWGDRKASPLVLVRPWIEAREAERLLAETANAPRVRFTWGLYEQHMAAVYSAVLAGELNMPEEPWDD